MRRVLVPSPVFSSQCSNTVEYLKKHGFEVVQNQYGLPFQFDRYADVMSEIDAVIAGVEVWDRERMRNCPRLKIIARFGIGFDNFDLAAAKELGILCTNAPGYNTNAVAEHTMGLILNITRYISAFNNEVREGKWVKKAGVELRGKTLGLVGCGAIARKVGGFAQAFGAEVIAYDPYQNEVEPRENIRLTSLEEVLSCSDIVSVHVPGNKSTYHLINEKAFAMMKEDSYFINTSRGSVVDEGALYTALASGRLAAAAADVFEEEPVAADNPLLGLLNFVATPHAAAITFEANRMTAECCGKAIVDYFEGRIPEHVLNP